MVYSYELDTVLSGSEMAYSQGWPERLPDFAGGFSEWQVQELAGQAFSLPSATTVAAAYYYNPWAPRWKIDDPDMQEELAGVCGD